ncbi:MAG: class I SAM-dependent methyltransferase, partial [Opitutales bacterium]|nr:class I SAM-dependent methyltransferase [Opitutales bacterium]
RAPRRGTAPPPPPGSGDGPGARRQPRGAFGAVEGYDFCEPMLEEARAKGSRSPHTASIPFRAGDCLNLDIPDDSFDAVTIAFGLRNLEDRHRGLREMRRILRPGRHLFVLEFTQPARWFRPLYFLYLKTILPVLAWVLCRNRSAYDYLAGSIEDFPSKESLSGELTAAGFEKVTTVGLHASIVAIHRGTKPLAHSRT